MAVVVLVDELELSTPVELGLEDFSAFGGAVINANALVWDRGWDFGADDLAVRSEDTDVGEGAADINSELIYLIHDEFALLVGIIRQCLHHTKKKGRLRRNEG